MLVAQHESFAAREAAASPANHVHLSPILTSSQILGVEGKNRGGREEQRAGAEQHILGGGGGKWGERRPLGTWETRFAFAD